VLNSEKKALLQASKSYIQLEITTLNGDILTIAEKSIEINAPPEKIWPLIQWDRTP